MSYLCPSLPAFVPTFVCPIPAQTNAGEWDRQMQGGTNVHLSVPSHICPHIACICLVSLMWIMFVDV